MLVLEGRSSAGLGQLKVTTATIGSSDRIADVQHRVSLWYNTCVSGSAQVHPIRRALRHWRWVWRQRRAWESSGRFVLLHALGWLGLNERATFRYQGARFRLYDTPAIRSRPARHANPIRQ
jgi:hypothetical protein